MWRERTWTTCQSFRTLSITLTVQLTKILLIESASLLNPGNNVTLRSKTTSSYWTITNSKWTTSKRGKPKRPWEPFKTITISIWTRFSKMWEISLKIKRSDLCNKLWATEKENWLTKNKSSEESTNRCLSFVKWNEASAQVNIRLNLENYK